MKNKNNTTQVPVRRRRRLVKLVDFIDPKMKQAARAYAVKSGFAKKRVMAKKVRTVHINVFFTKAQGGEEIAPFIAALQKQGWGAVSHFIRQTIREGVRKATSGIDKA